MQPRRTGDGNWIRRDPIAMGAAFQPSARACRALATGVTLTYAELDRAIARCAGFLARTVSPGARVALLARNSIHHTVLFYACWRTGAVFQPLNWRLAPEEVARMLKDAETELLVLEGEFSAAALAAEGRKILTAGELDAAIEAAHPWRGEAHDVEAPVLLLYTSGTTGAPKGVEITRTGAFFSAYNFQRVSSIGPASALLIDAPMFHTVGLIASMHGCLSVGGFVALSDRFVPAETLARLADPELGITHYFCVPQMARALREDPGYDPAKLARLAGLFTGGASMPPALTLAFLDDGIVQPDGYGMSEAGTVLGMPLDAETCRRKVGSSGVPAPALEIRLVGKDGVDVPEGEVGEIWLRGPAVTPGYWNQPQATAAVFHDGWLKTGDAARRDEDGYYFVVDRWKDMYISGGENVYPAEVEAALLEMPGLAEAAVLGAPDPRWGECGHAFLVSAPGASIDADAVRAFCGGRLARFKHPAHIHFVQALPRTGSGKLRKDLLKQMIAAPAGAAPPQ